MKIPKGPWQLSIELVYPADSTRRSIVFLEAYPGEIPKIEVLTHKQELIWVLDSQELAQRIVGYMAANMCSHWKAEQMLYTEDVIKSPEEVSDILDVDFREVTKRMLDWWTVLNTVFSVVN